MKEVSYTESLTNYKRRKTIVVHVGNIPMGSDYPVRLQSMANTPACDIQKSLEQCMQISREGSDYVRFTVPSMRDVQCVDRIRKELRSKSFNIPLIADVHFNPEIAMHAAKVVEKVRINPGNYGIPFKTAKTYADGKDTLLERNHITAAFRQFLACCRENKVAVRIGVNHGSLSDRITSKYGDTPEGMVQSAMEFLRICREENFNQVVVSMKSSNVLIMVQSTRLLASRMEKTDMNYPIHLGVTEAGEGEQGRIKSAAGIGALLADGIGDTIRVSLTEDPVLEIPVSKKLIAHIETIKTQDPLPELDHFFVNPFEHNKRQCFAVRNIGGKHVPVVIGETEKDTLLTEDILAEFGWNYERKNKTWSFGEHAPDYIFAPSYGTSTVIPDSKGVILPYNEWKNTQVNNTWPLYTALQYMHEEETTNDLHFITAGIEEINVPFFGRLRQDKMAVLVYACNNKNVMAELRWVFALLNDSKCNLPVIIRKAYQESMLEDFQIKSAADVGAVLIDGLSNGLWLSNYGNIDIKEIISTSYGILQACRMRISKTEYISCPSCGRTHFDLMNTLARIKQRTSHLKGLKIGVMGCIVNGPGEMADADYGYVGSGRGKIALYRSKQIIKSGIPEEDAVEELIDLIRENGDWLDTA